MLLSDGVNCDCTLLQCISLLLSHLCFSLGFPTNTQQLCLRCSLLCAKVGVGVGGEQWLVCDIARHVLIRCCQRKTRQHRAEAAAMLLGHDLHRNADGTFKASCTHSNCRVLFSAQGTKSIRTAPYLSDACRRGLTLRCSLLETSKTPLTRSHGSSTSKR